ncbi:sensor domain-containing protein [Brevibacillus ginsengisoli]|uniref:sensor domain-containing protein n=1 Tax=Brevibacillus ginsengisoli TaxID=363854 RepID=UPI003CE97F57
MPELLGTDEIKEWTIFQIVADSNHLELNDVLENAWLGNRTIIQVELVDQSANKRAISSNVALAVVPMFTYGDVSEILLYAKPLESTAETIYNDEGINRLIAENTHDLIALVDLNGWIRFASPSHFKILGYLPEKYQGTSCYQYIHPDDHHRLRGVKSELMQQKHSAKTDFRILHSDGHWKEIESLIFPVFLSEEGVECLLIVAQEITERKLDQQKIQYLAYNDPLTELPNRLAFRERLEEIITDGRTQEIAVLFLDIDRFKIVNDALGHPKGEYLLRDVGKRITTQLRRQDMLAKISGDEFTIILTDTSQEQASGMAERILRQFHEPFFVEGHEFFITATIGISMYPNDGQTVDQIERNSNTAMVHAKLNGGNQFQCYLPSMNRRSVERLMMENSIRRALDKEEFDVYYQPQVDLSTGRIMGLEALIRWKHPEKGMISPATFIPLAEETGLILRIGEWVLRKACSQIKAWHEAGFPRVPVSVNLSPRQFVKMDLADSIKNILKETGLEPEWLELEITESVLMQNSDANIAVLRDLRDFGIRISIDDFGTGYSSLGYLKRFPIDCLKIDQSFIRDMTKSREDAAIATAIITLAHNLNLRVIAEGIETEEQAVFLRSQRCNAMQGYLFSPPIPAHQCVALLEQEKINYSILRE